MSRKKRVCLFFTRNNGTFAGKLKIIMMKKMNYTIKMSNNEYKESIIVGISCICDAICLLRVLWRISSETLRFRVVTMWLIAGLRSS